jgi:hypothetical protein
LHSTEISIPAAIGGLIRKSITLSIGREVVTACVGLVAVAKSARLKALMLSKERRRESFIGF